MPEENISKFPEDGFQKLQKIVSTLRGKSGCPWDQKQTPLSLKKYLLEETEELAEAIESGDVAHICEELGDVFFILSMLIKIHEEGGHFTGDEVLASICNKMIRRHPHVYSDATAESEEELNLQWEIIKASESRQINSSTPNSLPRNRG
ncbi:MAG: nucleotide pyrophosphohydrolase [Desulfobulbaceae bacterium]|nr:nucleotide pyrophosphohydrolase [Desulfobulbaceae bacterium]